MDRVLTKKYLALGIVTLLVITTGFTFLKKSRQSTYKEAVVERGDLEVSILATGTVLPENRLEIKPPVAGRIEQVLVAEGQNVVKGQVLALMSSTERAALMDSAHSRGPEEVKKWEDVIKETPIIAPISGMIILKNVENGQTFTDSDSVLVMSNRLSIKVQVDETDLAKINNQQECLVILDSYPDQIVYAKVGHIAYEAKTVNNVTTYTITVVPDAVPKFMRSGMTANVKFKIDAKKDVILVPTEFVKYDQGKTRALVKTNDKNKPEWHDVKLGSSDGKLTEVVFGLAEKDTVLVPVVEQTKISSSPFSSLGSSKLTTTQN